MIYDLVISGRIVDINGVYESNIGIINGKIKRMTDSKIEGKKSIALNNSSLIFPGFIDCHVHLREDASKQWTYKEDFFTGSKAAIHGGVTTVADMPNTPEPAISRERILEKIELAKKSPIQILFYGGVTSENLLELKEMVSLVCGYKIYFVETTGHLILERNKLESAVKIISETKKPVVFHCYPEDLGTILKTCKKYGAKTHIAHVSRKDEVRIIKKYKNKMQLTCETCPHYLFFTQKDLKMVKPPLGSEEDRIAIMNALKKGTIDMLSSDHAPHTIKDKKNGASGFPGLDTYGNIVSWLLLNQKFKPETMARTTSYNPAKFLGLVDRGRIKEGLLANLTVLDTKGNTKIRNMNLQTKCEWSPFNGMALAGKILYTIYRGNTIMKNGKIIV